MPRESNAVGTEIFVNGMILHCSRNFQALLNIQLKLGSISKKPLVLVEEFFLLENHKTSSDRNSFLIYFI